MNPSGMPVKSGAVVVVGSGMSGLVTALSLAPLPVTLITKTAQLQGGSSLWAQGGIAAAIGPGDSAEAHALDTLSAGAGLSDPQRTRELTDEAAASLQWLVNEGIAFDRDLHGALQLAREAAHRFPRVVHAGGDTTGNVLMHGLIERLRETPSIVTCEDTFAFDLVIREGRCCGVVAFDRRAGWVFHQSANVVLCTGGIGRAWWDTTNPIEATGDGLAMAARAGARLADLEFVQFHPTALAVNSDDGASLPLLTEALRGAGALLLDASGQRFMPSEHALAELAPRDVVARAIEKRTQKGQRVMLDLRPIPPDDLRRLFPKARKTAQDAGFDPHREPLPITPAAHYHMGGIQVDKNGRTTIDRLWACGEVATTGIHGANRLASNSLLEALVYARRSATEISRNASAGSAIPAAGPITPAAVPLDDLRALEEETRKTMSLHAGILRDGGNLETAHAVLSRIAAKLAQSELRAGSNVPTDADRVRRWGELRNLNLVARLVTLAALRREESRGAHFRDDYPLPRPEWRRQQSLTMEMLARILHE